MKKKTTRPARPQAKPGIEIHRLDIPKARPRWPHVVALHLTDAQYQEFKKDPIAFDNKYGVYPGKPMIKIESYAEITPPPNDPPGDSWTVTIAHGTPSNGGIVACRQHDE